jgi:hypothetical protein
MERIRQPLLRSWFAFRHATQTDIQRGEQMHRNWIGERLAQVGDIGWWGKTELHCVVRFELVLECKERIVALELAPVGIPNDDFRENLVKVGDELTVSIIGRQAVSQPFQTL